MTNGDAKNASSNGAENGADPNQPPRLGDDEVVSNNIEGLAPPDITLAEVDALRADAAKAKNDLLYLRAEFENFKKQAIKERSDMRKYGSERLITEFLGILDILETALAAEWSANPESHENFRKGIDMTAAEMRNIMQRQGVQEAPALGIPFDPTLHEALSSEESDAVPGTITRVFKKPYRLHDRLIRPGQVVVAKPKP